MRVLCTGSRGWDDVELIHARLAALPPGTEVTVGGSKGRDGVVRPCRGSDTIVADYWRSRGPLVVVEAEWDRHGKAAGPLRNNAMLDRMPDLVIAFWRRYSRGTRGTIAGAMKRSLPIEIHWRP